MGIDSETNHSLAISFWNNYTDYYKPKQKTLWWTKIKQLFGYNLKSAYNNSIMNDNKGWKMAEKYFFLASLWNFPVCQLNVVALRAILKFIGQFQYKTSNATSGDWTRDSQFMGCVSTDMTRSTRQFQLSKIILISYNVTPTPDQGYII